ncbi:hypothetical protein [Amphiplicatus metriothermophilus]|uniref:PepSY-associated TM region n=1 Tax=Amphiplicatus metriothermophilus TaxID=1519374 RepID=A0A239PX37_9PROT|nr:hypothetical protein [Amphiplicatus metriothermophilus]MBB5519953.1 hypothetical protein [Amphiplicatus metriothermophilus]SNT74854.1 hypothetical protein SAMN06297382_2444 [Amphiplicatus metriothermophilus]
MKRAAALKAVGLGLGALAGALTIIWLASGAALSLLPADSVSGLARAQASFPAELETRSYANPGGIVAQAPGATELRLKRFLDRVVYQARGSGADALFDAVTGERLSPLSEDLVRQVATRDYVGPGALETLERIDAAAALPGLPAPLWRARFDDGLDTQLFISPFTGEVVARRNRLTRLHETLRAWHLLGANGRGAFALSLAAIGVLSLALSGAVALGVSAWMGARRRAKPAKK